MNELPSQSPMSESTVRNMGSDIAEYQGTLTPEECFLLKKIAKLEDPVVEGRMLSMANRIKREAFEHGRQSVGAVGVKKCENCKFSGKAFLVECLRYAPQIARDGRKCFGPFVDLQYKCGDYESNSKEI